MGKDLSDVALRLQAIIDTAIDGILTIDNRGIVESINIAAANLFQYNPEEVIGKNIRMLMPEPHKSKHDTYIRRYQESRQPRIIGIGREVQGLKKDGSIFPFRLAVSEVILNDRVIYTGVVHDLSEIKEAEEKLQEINSQLEEKVEARTDELEVVVNRLIQTNRKLEKNESELSQALDKERELNELKSRFVSMASHEFRTPLSTILSSTSLISRYTREDQDKNRQKHIERIKAAVANLTGILNDFLSLDKLEENVIDVQTAEIEMNDLCLEVSQELHGLLDNEQKILHRVIGKQVPFHSDRRILKNILFNLLSNAIKYSPKQQNVTCELNYLDAHLEIAVIDQGIGIPIHEQKHLFERFFRATNVETIQGTGLGLNIVKRYLDLLHGTIRFESTPYVGTTFCVQIPYKI